MQSNEKESNTPLVVDASDSAAVAYRDLSSSNRPLAVQWERNNEIGIPVTCVTAGE